MIRAVLWDFGGVVTSSPFEAFNRYEQEKNLPKDFIRKLNATNKDSNAWAQLERNEVDFAAFCDLFEGEARAAGGELDAKEVMALLAGDVRPEMVEAIRRIKSHSLKLALLTNNWIDPLAAGKSRHADVLELFDTIVESSRVGVRKPDPRFYQMACDLLQIEPSEAVFLDDLGINLKPAKELGMKTIKVEDPYRALAELESAVGFPVR